MSVTYGFYNSLNGDRKYDATQISSMFDGLIIDGIFASIGTAFVVKADTGNTVNVGVGKAWFNRTWTLNDAILPLEAPISEVLLDRIDAVVIEVDTSEAVRANSIKFVQGTPSSQPVRPTMASSETLHQYPLCYIYRAAGSTEITQADITNMVGTEETPFITGILQTISLDELLGQWEDELDQFVASEQADFTNRMNDVMDEYDDWFNQMKADLLAEKALLDQWIDSEQDDFINWFNQMKEILDEDAAGNILNLINNYLADYEYKTPIIDGTQIRLQKQSNTNILKFKLDADLSGGEITISLDNYLYVVGATQKVWKLNKSNLSKAAESISYGGDIHSITSDDNYLYVGGTGTRKVWKLKKSDLSKVSESIDYGGSIWSITSDDNYLYVGGGTTQKVWKLNKSDLSKVSESIDYGGDIKSITSDDNYLYVGGTTTQKVYKLKKSDLSKVSETIDYGGRICSITSDDNYLYVVGSTQKVWKLNKSNLSKVSESIDYGGDIRSITSDDNYLYVGGTTKKKVYKFNKSDLSKVSESISYGDTIWSITSDDNYLYVGGSTQKVWKLKKSDLSKVSESIDYGNTIWSIEGATSKPLVDIDGIAVTELYKGFVEVVENGVNFTYASKGASLKEVNEIIFSAESIDYGGDICSITSDDNYLYVGGGTTQKVYKLNKIAYIYKNLKLIVIGSV